MNDETNVPFPTAQEWAADFWQCGRTSNELRRMLQLNRPPKACKLLKKVLVLSLGHSATNVCAYKVWSYGAKMIVTNIRWLA